MWHDVACSWSWLGNDGYPEELQQRLEDHGVQLFYNLFEIAPAALKLFRFTLNSDGKVIDDAVRYLSGCLLLCLAQNLCSTVESTTPDSVVPLPRARHSRQLCLLLSGAVSALFFCCFCGTTREHP